MKKYARQLIYFTLIASVAFFVVLAIIAFASGAVIYGVLILICAALNALIYYFWRSRIPFATAMLQTVAHLLNSMFCVTLLLLTLCSLPRTFLLCLWFPRCTDYMGWIMGPHFCTCSAI